MPAKSFDYSQTGADQASNAVTAALAHLNASYTQIIVQQGNATGDISHVVAAIANAPDTGVLVVDGENPQTNGLKAIANVYVDQFKFAADRAVHVKLSGNLNGRRDQVMGLVNAAPGRRSKKLTHSTVIFRTGLNQAKLDAAKVRLRGEEYSATATKGLTGTDLFMRGFLRGEGIAFDRNTVILWGRRSGARGGMHPKMDHSEKGLKQICERCVAKDYQVIVAGDFELDRKLEPHKYLADNALIIGPYWESNSNFRDRFKQIRLFHVLRKHLAAPEPACGMVHVGMRSGGLDMFGFAGQNTIYLVAGSIADKRMSAVVDAFKAADLQSYDSFRAEKDLRKKSRRGKVTDQGFSDADLTALMDMVGEKMAII